MAKAKQLPSGAWRVRVYIGKDASGKAQYESITRQTKKEAEYAALGISLHHKDVMRDTANMTLKEAAVQYINNRRQSLSPSTIAGYEKVFRLYFQKLLDIPLKKITQTMLQREIDMMARDLSSKTIANAHGLLVAVFREFHPAFEAKTKLPKKQKFIPNIPGPEQIQEIFSAVQGTEIEIPVHLAIWLGMRMSEIRALRYDDIHDDYVVVNSAIVDVGKEAVEKTTKSFAGTRMIPAPKSLIDKIRALPHESEHDFVTHLSGQAIYKRFTRALEAADIPHMRFHDLRHANASIMLMLGVPDKYAMERLGHATNSILQNVYQHTIQTEQRAIASKINDYFEKIAPKE